MHIHQSLNLIWSISQSVKIVFLAQVSTDVSGSGAANEQSGSVSSPSCLRWPHLPPQLTCRPQEWGGVLSPEAMFFTPNVGAEFEIWAVSNDFARKKQFTISSFSVGLPLSQHPLRRVHRWYLVTIAFHPHHHVHNHNLQVQEWRHGGRLLQLQPGQELLWLWHWALCRRHRLLWMLDKFTQTAQDFFVIEWNNNCKNPEGEPIYWSIKFRGSWMKIGQGGYLGHKALGDEKYKISLAHVLSRVIFGCGVVWCFGDKVCYGG